VQHFLQHIGKKKTLLRQRINDNFHILQIENLAP